MAIVLTDQLVKQWVLASFEPNRIYPVLSDWIRIDFIHNAGGLFGMMQGVAPILAAITVGVVAVIVLMEVRWGWQSWLMTLALGLLLGGAMGNLIDRLRFGYVIDFVDIGAGTWRWYIFNVADSAITGFFLLVIAMWLVVPRSLPGGRGAADSKETAQAGAKEPAGR